MKNELNSIASKYLENMIETPHFKEHIKAQLQNRSKTKQNRKCIEEAVKRILWKK